LETKKKQYIRKFVQLGEHENNGTWLLHEVHPNHYDGYYDTEPTRSKIGLSITGQKNSCTIDEQHRDMLDSLNTLERLLHITSYRSKEAFNFKEFVELGLALAEHNLDYEKILEDALKKHKIKKELKNG
jgi:hypothetical protein